MPILINCPSCSRKLRVPDDLLGKNVKCPTCSTTFTANPTESKPPAPPPPREAPSRAKPTARRQEEAYEEERPRPARDRRDPEEDEDRGRSRRSEEEEEQGYEDEEEDRPRRSRGKANWGKVHRGLLFVLLAVCIRTGSLLFMCCCGFSVGILTSGPARAGAGAMPVLGAGALALPILVLILNFACQGLDIAGLAFCMSAPPKKGARTLATTALALTALASGLSVLSQLINLASGAAVSPLAAGTAGGLGGIFALVGNLIWLASVIVFLFFLRALALRLRSPELAQLFLYQVGLLGLVVVFFAVSIITLMATVGTAFLTAMSGNNAGAGPDVSAMRGGMILSVGCMCLDLVGMLASVIWYITSLVEIRSCVGEYLSERA